MSTPVGGLRDRLIAESVHAHLRACLDVLGWLTPDPNRADVTYLPRPVDDGEQIVVNSVATFADTVRDVDLELGSGLTENRWQWYADVFAEDTDVGTHLSGDIRDILRGKIPSAGAARPVIVVYDFTLATPVPIFTVEVEDVTRDRATSNLAFRQFWYVVPFTVVDAYDTESDASGTAAYPSLSLFPGPSLFPHP